MDKFGSHARKRVSLWRMMQDFDMNDNRITSLGYPKESLDAVTKRWVTQQLKDGMKDLEDLESECNQLRMETKRTQKEIKDLAKKLMTLRSSKVDKSECVSTNGGLMNTDIDMQKYRIRNLPLPQEDGDAATKVSFNILWDKIEKIEKKLAGL